MMRMTIRWTSSDRMLSSPGYWVYVCLGILTILCEHISQDLRPRSELGEKTLHKHGISTIISSSVGKEPMFPVIK